MQVSLKIVLGTLGVVALVGGAYLFGVKQAGLQDPAGAVQSGAGDESAISTPAPVEQPAAADSRRELLPADAKHAKAPQKPGREGVKYTQFGVGNRNVKSMHPDGKTMWIGTSGGVVRYDIEVDDYKLYDVRAGLLSNGIFHLSRLGDEIVVGTYGGGLSFLNPNDDTWRHYNIQHGLGDGFIYDFLALDNGDIWIATWSGANRIRGGDLDDFSKWETFTVENTGGGLPNDWVYGLAKGANGEVWMATEGGLARFEDEKWSSWKHSDGLGEKYELVRDQIEFDRDPAKESSHHARQKVEMGLTGVDIAYNPNYIVALHVDDTGVVWAGTWGGGLARFDGENWKNFTMKDGLPANHVFMLGPEKNGRIWVGTSKGLARFDGESFTVFDMSDGLFADNIFSMANGSDGSLWLGSFGGVTRMDGLETVE